MMNLRIRIAFLLPTLLLACTSDYAADDDRGRFAPKADELLGSCSESDCFGPAANGAGWCDDSCASFGDCADSVLAVCGFDECSISDEGVVLGCGQTQFCVEGECTAPVTPLPTPVECIVSDQGVSMGCDSNQICVEGECTAPVTPLPTPVECIVSDQGVSMGCDSNQICVEGECIGLVP